MTAHLLLPDDALGDHLVDGGLHERGRDRLSRSGGVRRSWGSVRHFPGCSRRTRRAEPASPALRGDRRPRRSTNPGQPAVRARISVSSSYTEPRQPRWPGCRSDAITRHTSGYLAEREPLYATPTRDNSSSGDSVSASAMHEQQNEPRSGRPEQTRHRAERQHRGLGDVEPRVGQRPAQPPLVRFIAQPSAAEQQRRLHRQEDQDRRGHQQQPGPPSAGRPGSAVPRHRRRRHGRPGDGEFRVRGVVTCL